MHVRGELDQALIMMDLDFTWDYYFMIGAGNGYL